MKRILLLFLLLIFTSITSAQALTWAYSFVVWDGNVYEVTEESVLEVDIGNVIGQVKTKPNEIGDYYGNASNSYPKGTKYYEIKGVSTELAIAVADEKQWMKAVYVQKAPFHWINLASKILPTLFLIAIAVVIIWRIKRAR
ncbi:hypothetical protein ACIQZG_19765 [Lysinibacillus sp. NPDC096418]|uniref:hypothetical protein n=1 Tax=Lysinibacillus sp. NPDC096418 TaxID=3364138 RepID=UPI0038182198